MVIENRPRAALPFLIKANEIDPNDLECCHEIWLAYAIMDMPDAALRYIDKILQNDPRNFESHCMKGDCYKMKCMFNEARTSYQKAFDIAPNDPRIQQRLHSL